MLKYVRSVLIKYVVLFAFFSSFTIIEILSITTIFSNHIYSKGKEGKGIGTGMEVGKQMY